MRTLKRKASRRRFFSVSRQMPPALPLFCVAVELLSLLIRIRAIVKDIFGPIIGDQELSKRSEAPPARCGIRRRRRSRCPLLRRLDLSNFSPIFTSFTLFPTGASSESPLDSRMVPPL